MRIKFLKIESEAGMLRRVDYSTLLFPCNIAEVWENYMQIVSY